MSANVLIREAQPDDAGAVLTAMRKVLSEQGHHFNVDLDEFYYTEDDKTAFIARINESDNSIILLAESLGYGEVVGLLRCQGDARRARQHTTRLSIAVLPDWRGRGVGRHLMERAINWAQRHPNIRRIELDVLARNKVAIGLYRKLGFSWRGGHAGPSTKMANTSIRFTWR